MAYEQLGRPSATVKPSLGQEVNMQKSQHWQIDLGTWTLLTLYGTT